MNITLEQKEYLKEFIPDLEEIIKSDDVNDLLWILDEKILMRFDSNYELDAVGLKLQKIYDDIYYQN